MNIFLLDEDMTKAAQFAVDRHVVKMPTETSQMLVTAVLTKYPGVTPPLTKSGNPFKPLSKGMLKHPCMKWVLETESNFNWLCKFGYEQVKEYTYRYGRRHFATNHIDWAANYIKTPYFFPANFPLAMPEHIMCANPVLAYRNYYNQCKRDLFKWKNRAVPGWIVEFCAAR